MHPRRKLRPPDRIGPFKASTAASEPLDWQPSDLVAHSASLLSEAIEKPAEQRELPRVGP